MTTADMVKHLESQGLKVATVNHFRLEKGTAASFNLEGNKIEKGGIVITEVTDCFPASAKVLTRDGVRGMDELKLGDCVQAYDVAKGGPQWSIVTAFLHREPNAMEEFVQLDTADGACVKATREHRVFTPSGDVYTSSVQTGHAVFTVSPDGVVRTSEVTSVKTSTEVGLYCPLTAAGTIVVDSVAYSCHANCTHRVGNILFSPLRWSRTACCRSGPELDGVHPYSKAIAYCGLILGSMIPHSIRGAVLADGLQTKVSMFEAEKLPHYSKPKAFGGRTALLGGLVAVAAMCMELGPRMAL